MGDYIGHAAQDERIRAGAAIKRVFIVDDEKEYGRLKRLMDDQKSIGIEVRWLLKQNIPQSKMVKDGIEVLGTLGLCNN
ncbi:MAG: hypothetical protein AB9891_15410 [Anaerolineaceae bacterium]